MTLALLAGAPGPPHLWLPMENAAAAVRNTLNFGEFKRLGALRDSADLRFRGATLRTTEIPRFAALGD